MAIIPKQVYDALSKAMTAGARSNELIEWLTRINLYFSDPDLTLTDAQKTALFSKYQEKKQAVIDAVNDLS